MQIDLASVEKIHNHIYPYQLYSAFEHYRTKIKVLSLDCFDTLIWRTTATPIDVFFAAAESLAFQSVGLTSALRVQAEHKARQLRALKGQSLEVTLADIYREHLPTVNDEQLVELTTAELAAEKKFCYVFPPLVDLIRAAHQQGIKIIIVSDTYFTENQLRTLLTHVLPEDVLQAIDKIFCSSEHHFSKANGLFSIVMKAINQKPKHFLHVGDNKIADYISARALSWNALHFIQDNDYVKTLQRLHSTAANIINPVIRTTKPLVNPFRALFTALTPELNTPDFLLGYYSLGPIMYSFAHFIQAEIAKMHRAGKQPKALFLMRDGHLPLLACQTINNQFNGHAVSISRFAAYAASFRTEEDIARYLVGLGKSQRLNDIAHQLLLPDQIVAPLIKMAEEHAQPEEEFMRLMLRNDIQKMIVSKSIAYWERLKRYLVKNIALQAGDTLVFVDLGYVGTVQRQLAPLFKEMNVELEGRYLLTLNVSPQETQRIGLLDNRHYDDKTLLCIVLFIALFEQLCTSNEKSAVDYDHDGNIIYSQTRFSDEQYAKLADVQQACLRFVHQAKNFFGMMPRLMTEEIRRDVTLAELARMLFLPTGPELGYLQAFQFDFNLGTKDIYPLFDLKQGLQGLKRRGLFYIDTHCISKRTHYPAELRVAGFELAMTFLSHTRFNLEANFDDMLPRREMVEIQRAELNTIQPDSLLAFATHDGYYSVWVKVDTALSFCIGKRYQWIQVESAQFIEEEAFAKQQEAGHILEASDCLEFLDIADHGNGLLQCLSRTSMIKLNPTLLHQSYIFRLVYRPLVYSTSSVHASSAGMT